MPKLGEFIGALLSDAVQARVRADLEALKVAETYSAHELLKHLPVPRFRLPDITVDFPVIISEVQGVSGIEGARSFDRPTPDEIKDAVLKPLSQSDLPAARTAADHVTEVVLARSKQLFESGPQFLLSPAKVSGDLAATVVSTVKAASRDKEPDEGKLKTLENATRASLQGLLLTKLVQSPYLDVVVTSSAIKSHANNDSVVRMRLTITEDAYEVINRDEGQGYYLTPE